MACPGNAVSPDVDRSVCTEYPAVCVPTLCEPLAGQFQKKSNEHTEQGTLDDNFDDTFDVNAGRASVLPNTSGGAQLFGSNMPQQCS